MRAKSWMRVGLLAAVAMFSATQAGCRVLANFGELYFAEATPFFGLPPFIPVSPSWSQEIEDAYWEEERYTRVPVLDPVPGEFAPIFCMDPPTPDEVMRAMPDEVTHGFPFVAEVQLNNVRIVVEPLVDSLGECRFYPLVGPAQLHKCHYRCTVYYERVIRSDWPIPYTFRDESVEVVYIDHDHLIRCDGPAF